MYDRNQIYAHYNPLWGDTGGPDTFPNARPLLAHYTGMSTFDAIMKNEELWLANPLFMNDMEELRFGLEEAARLFRQHYGIFQACGNPERYKALHAEFERQFEKAIAGEVLDTYVMCFCEHDMNDRDGLLSMWRGYGGNGSGAAIVFDISRMPYARGSPLTLARVQYGTKEQRLSWIGSKLDHFAGLIQQHQLPQEFFDLPVHSLIERFRQYALFSKHDGFKEEREWRMVYIRERDREGLLTSMFHYHIQNETIEPKLKYKLRDTPEKLGGALFLENLVHEIILGPGASSALTIETVKRMLKIVGKESLSLKVRGSTTPYRAKM